MIYLVRWFTCCFSFFFFRRCCYCHLIVKKKRKKNRNSTNFPVTQKNKNRRRNFKKFLHESFISPTRFLLTEEESAFLIQSSTVQSSQSYKVWSSLPQLFWVSWNWSALRVRVNRVLVSQSWFRLLVETFEPINWCFRVFFFCFDLWLWFDWELSKKRVSREL